MYNLTTSQHERVRNLVRRSPAFIGMRVVVHDDAVEVLEPEELLLGLGLVFEAVANAPADQWPSLVDDWLQRLLIRMTSGTPPELSGPTEQILDRVYAKLRPVDGSPKWAYAREIAPDLILTIALDFPDYISILNDEQVQQHGFDRLLDTGLENLHGQLPEKYGTDDKGVFYLTGTEYMASMVMLLPWVVENVTGSPDFPHGLLTAVPDDHTLFFHVLHDSAGARYALGEIARLAAECYEDSNRPLSRNVYWWAYDSTVLKPVAHHVGNASGVIGQDFVTQYEPDFAYMLQDLDHGRG